MANAFSALAPQTKTEKPRKKKTFAPVEPEEELPKKAEKKTVTKDKTQTNTTNKTPKKTATSNKTIIGGDFVDRLVTGSRQTPVTKSFTLQPKNFAKLERLVETGLYKKNSHALDAILDAIDVDAIIAANK